MDAGLHELRRQIFIVLGVNFINISMSAFSPGCIQTLHKSVQTTTGTCARLLASYFFAHSYLLHISKVAQ